MGPRPLRLRGRAVAPDGRLSRRLLRDRPGGRPVVRARAATAPLAGRGGAAGRGRPGRPRRDARSAGRAGGNGAGDDARPFRPGGVQPAGRAGGPDRAAAHRFRRGRKARPPLSAERPGPGGAGLRAGRLGRGRPSPARQGGATAARPDRVRRGRGRGVVRPNGMGDAGRTPGVRPHHRRPGRSSRFAADARRRGLDGSVRRHVAARVAAGDGGVRRWSARSTSWSAPASWRLRSSPPCRPTGRPRRRPSRNPSRRRRVRPSSPRLRTT